MAVLAHVLNLGFERVQSIDTSVERRGLAGLALGVTVEPAQQRHLPLRGRGRGLYFFVAWQGQ